MTFSMTTKLIAVAALPLLAACGGGGGDIAGPVALSEQSLVAPTPGPITTHPIVGRYKVPAGTTPTGDTGYAMANTTRTNATIVDGTAAQCGPANSPAYSDGCAHAAGLPAASTPYLPAN